MLLEAPHSNSLSSLNLFFFLILRKEHNRLVIELENCLETNKILKDLLLLKMSKEEIQKEVEPFLPHIIFFIEKTLFLMKNRWF